MEESAGWESEAHSRGMFPPPSKTGDPNHVSAQSADVRDDRARTAQSIVTWICP